MTVTNRTRSERATTFALLAAGLSMAGIGLLALLGWVQGEPSLTMWKVDTLSMAPSTAVLTVMFGAALCLGARMPRGRIAFLLTTFFGWVGVITSLLLFALHLLGMYGAAELLGLHITGTLALGNAPIGYSSAITAFCFPLAYGALLASGARGSWRGWILWGCGGLVTLLSFTLLLAYAFDNPVLIGKSLIPPTLNTSISMLIMGLAQLVLAARYTGRLDASSATDGIRLLPYALVFLVFTAGLVSVAYYYYRSSELTFRQAVESQLLKVSKMKTDELARWRRERLWDGALSQNATMTVAVRRLLETPHSVSAQREMLVLLGKYQRSIGYDRVFLLDAEGVTRMSVSDAGEPAAAILAEGAAVSLRMGEVMLQDLYRDEHDQRVYLAMMVPILDQQPSNRPLGVVVLRIDPSIYLYPHIQRWPTPSASAETRLVRQDGNDVLFLNDLRFHANAALTLRYPLIGNTERPAAKAVLGQSGMVEGVDYRGVPVIAALRAVPDSPWYIMSCIDTAEVYAPLRERMWLTVLLVSVLVCGLGTVAIFLWRQQKFVFYRRQHELTLALQVNEERYQSILNTAMDGFWLTDTQGRLLEVNETYCQMTGYSEQELLVMRVADLEAVETAEDIDAHIQKIMGQGMDRFESRHRRKDGSLFEVEVSIQYLPAEGGRCVAFLQDISERKQTEEELRLAASVFTHAREGIMITAVDGAIIDVNDAFSDITGYSRDEVLGQNPRLLSSGLQEKEFYEDMWRNLVEQGHWHGELWNRHKNGEVYPVIQTISAVRDEQGKPRHYVALYTDITLLKAHEQELERGAHYDALTSLPNRELLADRLHQGMVQTRRRGQRLAVAFLDLDGFKAINDNHGHEAGDHLLIDLATRMKQALREGDTLARLGGDEFVAVLLDLNGTEATAPFTHLLAAAAEPVQFGEITLQVSASLGITFYPQAEDIDADQLLRQADQAMYQAKLAGKNRYHLFDAEQDRSIRGRYESLERIRNALAAGEFVLYYQPKVNMREGKVIGAEALIRWQHPEKGLLLPDLFLPEIEDHSLAIAIGEWVIDTALAQMETWQAAGVNIPVSVNIGSRQMQQTDFVERLRALLAAHPNVSPSDLQLEVLETYAMKDLTKVSSVIDACRMMGVSFALDDFGTGYPSLTYLKHLPVAQLKIDKSFVRDMVDNPDDLSIVEGVIGLASAFRLLVIAEGAETVEHSTILLQLGCDLAQGYGIAHPMPADQLPGWEATWQPDSTWINLSSISRVDLPLLFANVEHRAWIIGMEKYLKGEREAPPPQDISQCRFGQWLNTEGLARFGAQPSFETVDLLHRQAHDLAAELCKLQAQGRKQEALARLGELHGLRDALLEQLMLAQQSQQ